MTTVLRPRMCVSVIIARRCCRSATMSPRFSSGVVISSFMIGSSSTSPDRFERLVERVGRGAAERQLVALGLVRFAAEQRHANVHQREAEQAAPFALLREHFGRRGLKRRRGANRRRD